MRVETDHSDFLYMHKSRVQRWAAAMTEWGAVIVHIKGSDNKLPDCLSRIYMLSEVSRRPEDYIYLISLSHDLAGHFSVKRALKNLKSFISWSNMLQDIQEYVKKCEACIRKKPFNKILLLL